ncbi:MAG: hypothetical protein HZA01_05620 [Nitrospinae bacterium]|nr:hypothetical protein [Nitrospinota bacterium]
MLKTLIVLGVKEAIRLSGGFVYIDPAYCWVDVLASAKKFKTRRAG